MPQVSYVGLAALQARAIEALTSGVTKAAHDLEGRAKGATPVDTGTLRASIHVEGPQVGGMSVEAKVQTGGESSGYAVYVHEGTGPHKINHPGTPAFKYLERPLIEMTPVYLAYMQRAAAAAF